MAACSSIWLQPVAFFEQHKSICSMHVHCAQWAVASSQRLKKCNCLCRGLHFLAIQEMEDSEKCSGMWLLIQRPLPDY